MSHNVLSGFYFILFLFLNIQVLCIHSKAFCFVLLWNPCASESICVSHAFFSAHSLFYHILICLIIFVLYYLILLLFLIAYLFLVRDRKGVDLYGRGGRKNLRVVWGKTPS